jgi:hypothetical protein
VTVLVLGLVIFLGVHSFRALSPDARTAMIARIGEGPYKGLYTLASIAGFVLIIWGFALASTEGDMLYVPASGIRHATEALMLPALVLAVRPPPSTLSAPLSPNIWAPYLLDSGQQSSWNLLAGHLHPRRPATSRPSCAPVRCMTLSPWSAGGALWRSSGFCNWAFGVAIVKQSLSYRKIQFAITTSIASGGHERRARHRPPAKPRRVVDFMLVGG